MRLKKQVTKHLVLPITSSTGVLNIRTDVSFTPTGVSATISTGNLQGTFWSQVVDDSNSDISWTEVHQAA